MNEDNERRNGWAWRTDPDRRDAWNDERFDRYTQDDRFRQDDRWQAGRMDDRRWNDREWMGGYPGYNPYYTQSYGPGVYGPQGYGYGYGGSAGYHGQYGNPAFRSEPYPMHRDDHRGFDRTERQRGFQGGPSLPESQAREDRWRRQMFGSGGSQMFDAWSGPHTGKGPRGYRRSDERIRDEISDALTRDPHVDATNVEVKVDGGEVTLNGTVDDRHQKRSAEWVAERVEGVRDIHNQIRVQRTSYATEPMGDNDRPNDRHRNGTAI